MKHYDLAPFLWVETHERTDLSGWVARLRALGHAGTPYTFDEGVGSNEHQALATLVRHLHAVLIAIDKIDTGKAVTDESTR